MNKILIILSFVLLTSCGPSAEASEKLSQEKANRIAAEKGAEKQRIADSKPTVKEEFHSNGKLWVRTNYQSKNDGGQRDGLDEGYHDNGQLRYKRNYKDGKPVDGIVEWFHANGQLELKGNYKDGEEEGLFVSYHDNGQLVGKVNYKEGKQDGLWQFYHENGQVSSTSCLDNGEMVDMSRCEK